MKLNEDFFLNNIKNEIPPLSYSNCITQVLSEFKDILTNELLNELPHKRDIDHKIELMPWMEPQNKASFGLNQSELVELKRQLTELLIRGYVRPSKSPFGTPVLFMSKKYGQLRICINFCGFNRVIVKNNYHLRVDDFLVRLAGATHFSQIDLKSIYYQIRVASEDVHKLVMRTRYGSYEFLIMSFKFCNAPTTFMCILNGYFIRKWTNA